MSVFFTNALYQSNINANINNDRQTYDPNSATVGRIDFLTDFLNTVLVKKASLSDDRAQGKFGQSVRLD